MKRHKCPRLAHIIASMAERGERALTFDDIRVALRGSEGMSLDEAQAHIRAHLTQTRECLQWHFDWPVVLVTDAHFDHLPDDCPEDEGELFRCVAGYAGQEGVGLQLVAKGSEPLLHVAAQIWGLNTSEGKRRAVMGRIEDVAERKLIDSQMVYGIAADTGMDKVKPGVEFKRIAAKADAA